jgi:translin
MNLEALVANCTTQIETSHAAREQALAMSRALVRQCANTIRATHRGQADAADLLRAAGELAASLRATVADQPNLRTAGYTQDALKEYVEASLVYTFLAAGELPDMAKLDVEPGTLLNGLAEAASELRRAILDRLRRGEVQQSEALLSIMEDIYSLLMTVDYPDALTGGLRRNTDSLRGVLERTRGDVTAALRQERLIVALAAFEQRLQAEQGQPDALDAPDTPDA